MMKETKLLKFPEGFLWGASSSSHQAEGGNNNDWTRWEKANAHMLAGLAEKRLANISPVWGQIKTQAKKPANYVSGSAADHYHRYEEDFDIAKSLNMNAQRISLEWARIEPTEGSFDDSAIDHYRDVIKALRARGMEPFVTIWHWTLPLWVADQGGWLSPKTRDHFLRYATKVVEELGSGVKFWVTLNEPDVHTEQAYRRGLWPPNKKGLRNALKVARRLVSAHNLTYRQIKVINPDAMVGVAKNNIHFNLRRHWLIDFVLRNLAEAVWNRYFLNRIKHHQDFIGLNHYFHYKHKDHIKLDREHHYTSDIGWDLHPESIYFVLKNLSRYRKPIYITENGLADSKDNFRGWYIENILRSVHQAIDEGVDVKGYLHWSLTDNFEWDHGFWPRFGLVEIDYETLKRKVRPSAQRYAEIIAQNGVTPPDPSA